MHKDYIKEAEESYYLQELIKYFNEQGEIASISQYPIPVDVQKEMKPGDSVSDALIVRNGKPYWVEIGTMSRSQKERSTIGKERKGKISTVGIIRTMNLSSAHSETVSSLYDVISQKCAKSYSKFAEATQTPNGILLVGFINSDPFFTFDDLCKLTESIDGHTLDSLGCGSSNFSEIYFSCYVMMPNREWHEIVVCIANTDMMNRARDKFIRKCAMLKELEKRKESQK